MHHNGPNGRVCRGRDPLLGPRTGRERGIASSAMGGARELAARDDLPGPGRDLFLLIPKALFLINAPPEAKCAS